MSQLSLLFHNENNSYLEEDFLLLSENAAARNFLEKFFAQRIQSLILKGAEASGKTHLLNIFSRKFAAEFLDREKIFSLNLVSFFAKNHFYILEDFDQIKDEEGLLRLINSAQEAGAFLLLSARELPKFRLKDLSSRLKNIIVTEIENPSDEAMEQLLTNRLARKQIRLSPREIKTILKQVPRSYVAIENYFPSP